MKRLSKTILMLFAVLLPAVSAVAGNGHEQLLQRAHQLLADYKDREALALYEQVLSLSSDNYEALCNGSILYGRIGDRFTDDTRKLEYFTKAKQYALRAYELSPDDAESNYVMAISLACIAKVSGPKQRLGLTNQIKSFVDAALLSDGQHAGAWHVLGRWHYKMANLNFAEVAAAKMFFGGVCETATTRDAVEALTMAIRYNPNNILYYYDLATVYQDLKDKKSTISTLEQALTLNLATKEELELSRRCKIMLQGLTK